MIGLAPPEYLGQFYGLYALAGRFAALVGPLLWALVVDVLGLGRPTALLVLLGLVLVAMVILRPLSSSIGRPDSVQQREPDAAPLLKSIDHQIPPPLPSLPSLPTLPTSTRSSPFEPRHARTSTSRIASPGHGILSRYGGYPATCLSQFRRPRGIFAAHAVVRGGSLVRRRSPRARSRARNRSHQCPARPLHRRGPGRQLRSPRSAARRRSHGLRPLHRVHALQPPGSGMAESRPLRSLRRPRFGPALQPALHHRLRSVARRAETLPPAWLQDPGPSRTSARSWHRCHHRSPRAGLRQWRWHGHRRALPRHHLQPPRIRRHRPLHLRHRLRRRPDGGGQPPRPPRSPVISGWAS